MAKLVLNKGKNREGTDSRHSGSPEKEEECRRPRSSASHCWFSIMTSLRSSEDHKSRSAARAAVQCLKVALTRGQRLERPRTGEVSKLSHRTPTLFRESEPHGLPSRLVYKTFHWVSHSRAQLAAFGPAAHAGCLLDFGQGSTCLLFHLYLTDWVQAEHWEKKKKKVALTRVAMKRDSRTTLQFRATPKPTAKRNWDEDSATRRFSRRKRHCWLVFNVLGHRRRL